MRPFGEHSRGEGSWIAVIIGGLLLFMFATQGPKSIQEIHQSSNAQIEWTVLDHKGFNTGMQCWILQLDRRNMPPDSRETAEFCAKSQQDYDSHANGSLYVTDESWTDNVIKNLQPTDGA